MAKTTRLDLEDFLAELKRESEPILYLPNPGNAGDSLIAHATRQVLDRVGLSYVWVNDIRRVDPRGRVVVYGGGGNLVPLYDTASRALRWADAAARRVILLPHTISGHEKLLADLSPRTELICREVVSYEYVSSAVRSARCHLADDVALSADVGFTLATLPEPMSATRLYGTRLWCRLTAPALRKRVASPRRLRRSERLFRARQAENRIGKAAGILHAFRTDAEQSTPSVPEGNLDLSRIMAFGTWDANACHTAAHHVLRFLNLCEEIRTNRLHLAIGAALLGKRVEFHPNSYFKNRAVYEYSLRDRFPDVHWAGREDATRATSFDEQQTRMGP
jgi:exopolysaccharide biosynthesis predicted pyruvyltransferase EpsI